MKEHYVYFHIGKNSGKVFYVGAGKAKRMYDRRHNKDWIEKVKNEGGYDVWVHRKGLTKKEAMLIEQEVIDELGLENLTNMTSNRGNKTSFTKGNKPWNKGLTECQDYATKKVIHEGFIYDSVKECITVLCIGKTTFYRWVKKKKIKYVY